MNIKPRILLSAPDNRPWAMGRYLKDALDKLSVPVRLFDFRDARNLKAELKQHLEEFKPELHLIFKGELFDREAIRIVRETRVPTVLWHHDVDPHIPSWLIVVAGESDYFFTHARGMVDRFREAGIRHTHWLSEGYPERHFSYDTIEEEDRNLYSCQVMLAGNIHMNSRYRLRGKMLERALDEGFDVKWWGPRISWRLKNLPLIWSKVGRAYGGKFLANEEFAKAVNCAAVFLARDLYPEVDASVSNRLYWACGAGCFYLSHHTVGMDDIMKSGKEIETFTSLDEMSEKIRYYLDHPAERKCIAEAGRKRVLNNYTLKHRLSEMLERVNAAGVI
ncbi:MAG: glycosyltransferase [Planctomycetes bacterium]|nr:glycosyltransferase [Planctomycetota bacterium]